MKSEIVLIGPIGSGKTTLAQLLYNRTMLQQCSMDLLRWVYFEEIGYDQGIAREKISEGGFWALYKYWKPFEAYAVKRLFQDHKECIFDLGGSSSVYEDDELFKQVSGILAPYPHVVLLMPSPDIEELIQILNARNTYATDAQREVSEHLVRHHSNYDLAKYTAYTKDKSPEETCEEIIKWTRKNGWVYEPQEE